MTPMEQLRATILREDPGAYEPDPKDTKNNAFITARFGLRLDSGEEQVIFCIFRGANGEGRQTISRIERAFHLATLIPVYVKLIGEPKR